MATINPETGKRTYHRRTPEEIAADKAAKEARRVAREKSKMEKNNKKENAKMAKKNETVAEAEAVVDEVVETTSKKKATKKSGNGQKPVIQKKGAWSDPRNSMHMEKMFIEVKLIEPALGTTPGNKDVFSEYIASKAPDAATKEEEIASFGEEEIERKQTTTFMKGWFRPTEYRNIDILDTRDNPNGSIIPEEDGNVRLPFIWNYQIRGMFKDSCGLLSRSRYGLSADMSAYKKVIDGGIMVHPRRIAIELPEYYYDEDGVLRQCDPDNLPILQRPLRISGPSGERTALASSEMIPAGSSIKFCIEYADPRNRDVIVEWLNYGSEHGIGAWRNSGRGSFIWRELNPDYSPIEVGEDEE